jgi:hypothetical protein
MQAKKKCVEFRSPRQPVVFQRGMFFLFARGAESRRNGRSELLFAAVSAIVCLTAQEAYTRFNWAAKACNLNDLMTAWRSSTVQCIVLVKESIRLAHEYIHLAKGCLSIVRQFAVSTGMPHFCLRRDVGKKVLVTLLDGSKVEWQLVQSWPSPPIAGSASRNSSSREDRDDELDGGSEDEEGSDHDGEDSSEEGGDEEGDGGDGGDGGGASDDGAGDDGAGDDGAGDDGAGDDGAGDGDGGRGEDNEEEDDSLSKGMARREDNDDSEEEDACRLSSISCIIVR